MRKLLILMCFLPLLAISQNPTMDNVIVRKTLHAAYVDVEKLIGSSNDEQRQWVLVKDDSAWDLIHLAKCYNYPPYAISSGTQNIKIHGYVNATSLQVNDVAITTTPTKLNYLTNATGTTGTTSTKIVFSTSPTFTTSVLGGSSIDVFNTGSTTINFGGAVTTLGFGNTATGAQTINMFNGSTGSSTYNIATGSTASENTKTLNIGIGGASGSTTVLNMGAASGTTYAAIGGAYSSSYTLKVYGTIYATGAITSNSDIRDKNIYGKMGSVLDGVSRLELIDFTFKNDNLHRRHYGFSAQNLNSIFPSVAIHNSNDKYELDHLGISAINTKAIQELIDLVKKQQEEINELNERVKKLEGILL